MKATSYLFFLAGTFWVVAGSAVGQESAAVKVENHTTFTPSDIRWQDGPNALPVGVQQAILEGNPAKSGPFTLRLKFPANYKIPAHWHPNIEHVTVLVGTFHLGMGDKLDDSNTIELPAGSFAFMPTKMHHYAWSGDEETIIQLHGVGPWAIHYLNPKDDPRKNK